MPTALAVIPARYASTRFPGKPLAAETGKPLIQHVVERVLECRSIDRVVVATDDPRILEAVVSFGGEAVMTGEHPNGTSRIAEAVDKLGSDHELIVNVQGDEPEVPADTIDALVRGLADDADAQMATLASPFEPGEDPRDPNVVKLVLDRNNRAMYFSRSLIPHDRDAPQNVVSRESGCVSGDKAAKPRLPTPGLGGLTPTHSPPLTTHHAPVIYKHPGLYAYRRAFLKLYPTLEPTPLEQAEKLEQLRVLEHGHPIAVIHAPAPHPGIDTPQQYAAFVKRYGASHR